MNIQKYLNMAEPVVRVLSYPAIVLWLLLGLWAVVPVIAATGSHAGSYAWFAAGAGIYVLARRLSVFARNEEWLRTFSHELNHAAVGIMFFRRIQSFSASADGGGMIVHSGRGDFGRIFISLAPYCLPLATYALLLLKLVGSPEYYYVFDLLTGFSVAFYVSCFVSQTGNHQTDITGQGVVRAYCFICAAWLFNASVVLLSVRMSVWKAVAEVFSSYAECVRSIAGAIV